MKKHLKVYLAGKMNGLTYEEMNSWREEISQLLLSAADYADYDLTIINPVSFYNFEETKHQSEKEIKEFDLAHVTSSDIVIVNLEGLASSDGTKIELHDAKWHNKIPVIAFGEEEVYNELHSWHKDNITRVENNMLNAVRYIREFYMV